MIIEGLICDLSNICKSYLTEEEQIYVNNEWDKFDGSGKKPKSIDDYIDELNKKYVVGYTHCG